MILNICDIVKEKTGVTILPIFEGETYSGIEGLLETLLEGKRFTTKLGSLFHTTCDLGEVVLLGMGKREEQNQLELKTAFAGLLTRLRQIKAYEATLDFSQLGEVTLKVVGPAVEGLLLKAYTFDKYKTGEKEAENFCVNIVVETQALTDVGALVKEVSLVCDGVNLTRDLVNEPSNVIYPATLAEAAVKAGVEAGFEVKVIDELGIEKLGMKAFQAVAQGSDQPPRLIVLRYKGDPENPEKKLGYVGKGLTYDSGGYAIKSAEGMVTMKSDMGGAAAVIGAMSAIAKAKLKVNVVGVIAACENMISGHAYRNGDIIGSMAGKTIEIINTDAEGRLTLIDAVTFAIEKENVTKLVDVATLTGAALVALGLTTTAVITNDQDFCQTLMGAADKAGERMWQLPSFDEYKKLYKSDIADFKNSGGRMAGTIGAGLFIGEFVKNTPWLHLDIAGTSWSDNDTELGPKGGSGAPVRTLYQLAKMF